MYDRIQSVLEFWFGVPWNTDQIPPHSKLWFQSTREFDQQIRDQFASLHHEAMAGYLDTWADSAGGALALVLVLDQFSRHLYRGTPASFECDPKAKALARHCVDNGLDLNLPHLGRAFLYLPFEHAEDLADQERCVSLYEGLVAAAPPHLRDYLADNLRYAERHREIIERFGRFPHRNAILGRRTTLEEDAFLKEPMSSF